MLKSIANFAEFERRQTAERIANSFKARAERGLYNGGPIPFGYKLPLETNGRLDVDEAAVPIVKMAFKAFLEHETLNEAAKWLNEQGVSLPQKMQGGSGKLRSRHFLFSTLHHILTNKAYIGIRCFKTKEGVRESKAAWDPIIDEKTFGLVQEKLTKNYQKKKPTSQHLRYPYLLSGLTVCGTCGKTLCGKSAHGRSKKYPFYEHANVCKVQATKQNPHYECQPHRFPGDKVEDFLWHKVMEILGNPEVAQSILMKAKKEHLVVHNADQLKRLKDQGYKIAAQINSLAVRLSELPSDVDATPIYNQMKKLNLDKSKLENYIRGIENELENKDYPAELEDYEAFLKSITDKKLDSLSPSDKTYLIQQLIHKIELLPKGMKVHYYIGKRRINPTPGPQRPGVFSYLGPNVINIGDTRQSELKKISLKSGSSSLTNGGPSWARTSDPYHVKVIL